MLRFAAHLLVSLGLVLCSGLSLRAQNQAPRLTVQDIFNLELATDPQISPDGRRIGFVRQFSEIMTDRRYSNLWIVNFDGTDHRPLTTGNYNETTPRWSPDGTQLAYISNPDGAPEL